MKHIFAIAAGVALGAFFILRSLPVNALSPGNPIGAIAWSCQMSRCFAYRTDSGEIIMVKGAGEIAAGVRP